MNAVLNFGKYLFAIPFAVFGVLHLMNADSMAGMSPFGGAIIIYITGVALIAAAVSIIIGKMDKLATVLLALMMLLTALLVNAIGLSGAADEMASQVYMTNLLKDFSLAGAAMLYALHSAKDNAVIG